MGTIRRQILLNTLKLFDLALMVLSFALGTVAATQARGWVGLEQFLSMRVKIGNFVIFSCMLLVWHLVFSVFGIYTSRRLSGRWEEMRDIVKASTVGTLAIMLGAAIFHVHMITFVFAAAFWVASAAGTMLSRLVLRHVLKRVRLRGRNLRDMVVEN